MGRGTSVRGKHYAGDDASFHTPVYLDEDVQNYLAAAAAPKGLTLTQLVNDLLRKEVAIVETMK